MARFAAGRNTVHIDPAMEDVLQQVLAIKLWAVGVWLVLLFAAERLWPAARPARDEGPFGWRRLLRNAGLWAINTGLSPLVVLPITVWAAANAWSWREAIALPDWWSPWLWLAVDLVVLDLFLYWWHRANHEIAFLWRFHAVHHLDRFLDTTSAVRFHFGEVLLSAVVRGGFIMLADIGLTAVIVFETLVLVATLFHHSNLRLPGGLERGLARLVITPSIHWVHHHAVRRDTDSNYGTVFSFWDRLFGTRNRRSRDLDMTIGVEGRGESDLLGMLTAPFRRRD